MFQWVRLFCRLGVPPRAPRRDLLQQLLSNILRLGFCYSLNACASSSSPPASSLSVRPLRHSDSLPPKKNTKRLIHIQTQPHSDSLTIRLTHNQFSRTQTHTQAHPHSDSLSQGTRTQRYPHNQPIHIQIHALWASQGVAARGALHSQPEYSHSESPDIKLPHTQADSYSKQQILMWQA